MNSTQFLQLLRVLGLIMASSVMSAATGWSFPQLMIYTLMVAVFCILLEKAIVQLMLSGKGKP